MKHSHILEKIQLLSPRQYLMDKIQVIEGESP